MHGKPRRGPRSSSSQFFGDGQSVLAVHLVALAQSHKGQSVQTLARGLSIGVVARAFSGDKAQLVPLVKAAMHYKGFAFIDVISPCVTFNNHAFSTKSYDYVREHNQAVDKLDVVPSKSEITADYDEGSATEVTLHDGAALRLRKLESEYDPTNFETAIPKLEKFRDKGEVAIGMAQAPAFLTVLIQLAGSEAGA